MDTNARYWFKNGFNPNAVAATVIGGLPAIISVVLPSCCSTWRGTETVRRPGSAPFSWFVGCGLGDVAFVLLERRNPMIKRLGSHLERATDGVGL